MACVTSKIGSPQSKPPRYTTAHHFIAKHGLDPDYLEKIAKYITQHAGAAGPTLGGGPSGGGASGAAAAGALASKPPPPPPAAAYVRFDKPLAVRCKYSC
jgi:hypothetical protein